jgi:hypothetical protein
VRNLKGMETAAAETDLVVTRVSPEDMELGMEAIKIGLKVTGTMAEVTGVCVKVTGDRAEVTRMGNKVVKLEVKVAEMGSETTGVSAGILETGVGAI